ncbi:hypothetical protein [Methylobacterium durans]|nr:hypothetical protein [Methylobacterium durans]
MKMRTGLSYRTRDGRIAGPVLARGGHSHPWEGRVEGLEEIQYWTDDGLLFASGELHNLDLVGSVRGSAGKAIDQMTLDDYRRGVARLRSAF